MRFFFLRPKWRADGLSRERIDRTAIQRGALRRSNPAEAVHGKTKPVHDPAEQCVADGHRRKSSPRHQPGTGPNT